ncbi:glycosyl transferase [bacterium]|nr:glycosyl transferase [bacterium]
MLGRMAYKLWFQPTGWARRVLRQGPLRTYRAARGEAEMRQAAMELGPLAAGEGEAYPVPVVFLTGAGYWHQTIFCARSLQRFAPRPIRFRFHDDGSLPASVVSQLRALFSGCEIVGAEEASARVERHLPAARFPTLRARRLVYPHLRKLTDIHAGQDGWALVLDSDMLFHRAPLELLSWMEAPRVPIHLTDTDTFYGYSLPLLRELIGGDVPLRVNVGIIGLRSEAIDWHALERWVTLLHEREGTQYLQEQALTALLIAGRDAVALPPDSYRCLPDEAECLHPTAILHHYVAESRLALHSHCWRAFA